MLAVPAEEIRRYAESEHIPYHEDRTNLQPDRQRNRIRHQLIPVMEEVLGQKFLQGYKKSAAELRDVYHHYREYVQREFHSLSGMEDDRVSVILEDLNTLGRSLRRHMIEYCIYSFYGLYSNLEKKQFDAFERFLESSQTGGRFHLTGRILVEKDRDNLIFFPRKETDVERLELIPGKSVSFGRNIIRMNAVSSEGLMWNNSRNEEYICGDNVKLPLLVRKWKSGDRFFPLGMSGGQKVSDFFINRKIPRSEKERIPIVVNGTEIVWVAGLRLDDRYRIGKGCKEIYKLTLESEVH
jgi:tRNA(Ile)-lysidine synthase